MVESKSIVLQMIPHTLFIEWDFWTLFTGHCSLVVLLFMTLSTSHFTFTTLFTSHFTVHNTVSLVVGTVHDTIH